MALARAVSGIKALSGGDSQGSLRTALEEAYAYPGLSLIHVPVFYGPDVEGGMGAYGQWNVGPWCDDVQRAYAATQI